MCLTLKQFCLTTQNPTKDKLNLKILGEARWREREGEEKMGWEWRDMRKKKERGRGRFNIIPVHTWSKLPDLSKDNSQRRQTH